jgi:hypothetical protein
MTKLKGTELAAEKDRFVSMGTFEMADNPKGTIVNIILLI